MNIYDQVKSTESKTTVEPNVKMYEKLKKFKVCVAMATSQEQEVFFFFYVFFFFIRID
jgi:hypothetical protein